MSTNRSKVGEPSITDPTSQRGPRASYSQPWMNRWMAILHTIGNIQAWILLSLFYVVILTPFGVVFRLFADPLRLRRRHESNWVPLARQYGRIEEAQEQS